MGNGAPAGAVSSDLHVTGAQTSKQDISITDRTYREEELAAATSSQQIVDNKAVASTESMTATTEEDPDTGKRAISELMEEWSV